LAKSPIVFGSITSWKPYTSQTLTQFISTILALNPNNFKSTFLNGLKSVLADSSMIFESLIPLIPSCLNKYLEVNNSNVIGKLCLEKLQTKNSEQIEELVRKTHIFSCLAVSGKHSVFIFDPVSKQIYMKAFIVDTPNILRM